MIKAKHYFELHITAMEGDDFEHFRNMCNDWVGIEWRASRFQEDDVDGMSGKWFCSARVQDLEEVMPALRKMRNLLLSNGYLPIRAKAEDTLFDTRCGDMLD